MGGTAWPVKRGKWCSVTYGSPLYQRLSEALTGVDLSQERFHHGAQNATELKSYELFLEFSMQSFQTWLDMGN